MIDGDAARRVPGRTARVCSVPGLALVLSINQCPRVGLAVTLARGLPRVPPGSPTRTPAAPQRPAWGLPRDVVGAPTPPDGP